MQVVIVSCVIGAMCAMGLWAAWSVQAAVDEVVRRGGRPFPPGEP
jgi:hypothetical protein